MNGGQLLGLFLVLVSMIQIWIFFQMKKAFKSGATDKMKAWGKHSRVLQFGSLLAVVIFFIFK